MYQVIVAGAGPAGAYLAYLLAKNGVDVLLLEKESFPRYKPCGGGVTGKALQELDFDVTSVVKGIGYSATFTHKFKKPVIMTDKYPIAHLVDRREFDAFLVQKATQVGAKLVENAFVRNYELEPNGVVVYTEGKEWRGQYLVGADGAYSRIARQLEVRPDGVALTLEADLPRELVPSSALIRDGELLVDYGIIPSGYAWAFPNQESVAIGIGNTNKHLKGERLRALLGQWMNYLGVQSNIWRSNVRGWIIPFLSQIPELHGDREILVGDAAGLADAFTGEGLYAAFLSAKVASEVLLAVLGSRGASLARYTDQIRKALGAHVTNAYRLNRLFYPLSQLVHEIIRKHPEWHNIVPQIASGDMTYEEAIALGMEKLHIPFGAKLMQR